MTLYRRSDWMEIEDDSADYSDQKFLDSIPEIKDEELDLRLKARWEELEKEVTNN